MGEFTQTKERPVEEQAPLSYEERQRLRREEVLQEFADTPLAYTHADGTTRTVHGAYAVVAECPPLQDESMDADYLRQVFTAAALLAEQLAQEAKPDEDEPKDLITDEQPTEEPQPAPAPRQQSKPPAEEVKVPKAEKAEPIVDQPVEEPKDSPIVTEPAQERPVDVPVAAQDEPEPAVDRGPELSVAPQASAEPSVAALVSEPLDSADRKNPDESSKSEVESINSSETAERSPLTNERQPAEGIEMRTFEATNDLKQLVATEEAPAEVAVTEPQELPREERVAMAVQEVLAVIEKQDESDTTPEIIEMTDGDVPEEAMRQADALPVVDIGFEAGAEQDDTPEIFEVPRLPDAVFDHDISVDSDDVATVAGPMASEEGETIAANENETDDVIEHVEMLTRILKAEQEPNEPEAVEPEPELDSSEQAEYVEQPVQSETERQIDNGDEPEPETVVLDREITDTLEALGIEAQDTAVTFGEDPIVLRNKMTTVIKKIESLETAVSAQECHEAVQELRSELIDLLELFGYTDASFKADQLLGRWRYDLESLKRYMFTLQKTIASLQSNAMKSHHGVTKPAHWRYGASAVRLVVRITIPSPDQQLAVAA